jgi:hypothetical protein
MPNLANIGDRAIATFAVEIEQVETQNLGSADNCIGFAVSARRL